MCPRETKASRRLLKVDIGGLSGVSFDPNVSDVLARTINANREGNCRNRDTLLLVVSTREGETP